MAPILIAASILIGALNLVTVLAFRTDKDRARLKGRNAPRRIPQGDLLLQAALGGTPGAYAARHYFRHKTRKQPFSAQLHGIALVQVGVLVALAWR